MIKIIGVRAWALASGLSLAPGLAVGLVVHGCLTRPAAPPDPCVDTADIRSAADSEWACKHGARLEVYPMGGYLALFKCVCAAAPAATDAGLR